MGKMLCDLHRVKSTSRLMFFYEFVSFERLLESWKSGLITMEKRVKIVVWCQRFLKILIIFLQHHELVNEKKTLQ